MLIDKEIYTNLTDTAIEQLHSYPTLPFTMAMKRIISSIYHGKTFVTDRYSWPNALLAISLENCYNAAPKTKLLNEIIKYMNNYIKSNVKINALDNTMNGYPLLFLYELDRNNDYKNAILKMIEYLYNHDKDSYGSLIYRDDDIYVDTIGMICPFLCRYAAIFQDTAAKEFAITQIKNYINYGMDEKTNLPYHGYNSSSGLKKGIIGWGRGVGWLLLGIIDTIQYIDETDKDYVYLSRIMQNLVYTVVQYQITNGFFTWQLSALSGACDTSATAMILYSIQRALLLDIIDSTYYHNVEIGVSALLHCHDYKTGINDCSAECGGFSVYPQRYGSYPWSIAPTLSLLSLI